MARAPGVRSELRDRPQRHLQPLRHRPDSTPSRGRVERVPAARHRARRRPTYRTRQLRRQGALGIASLPEYWRNHAEELDAFVDAGVDGFEIVNCAPKGLAFPAPLRRQVLALAQQHDLVVVGASDNHGWGQVTCVWNLSQPGTHGYRANRVVARPLALLQGEWLPWTAPITQPWFLLRSLTWSERVSWLTWVLVILLYRAMPRRQGQPAGIGILARSLGP